MGGLSRVSRRARLAPLSPTGWTSGVRFWSIDPSLCQLTVEALLGKENKLPRKPKAGLAKELSVLMKTLSVCPAQGGSHKLCMATKGLECGYYNKGAGD